MDTLQDFQVNYKHVIIPAFSMEAEKDFDFELPLHQTTELHKLQPAELHSMPTSNIICEHLLATFSHGAVSKFRNRDFLAKGIKDNTVLHQANQSTVLSITKTSKITQSDRQSIDISTKEKAKRRN